MHTTNYYSAHITNYQLSTSGSNMLAFITSFLNAPPQLVKPTMLMDKVNDVKTAIQPFKAEPHPQQLCCCMHILLHSLRCLGLVQRYVLKQQFQKLRQADWQCQTSVSSNSVQISLHSPFIVNSIVQFTSLVQSPESSFYNYSAKSWVGAYIQGYLCPLGVSNICVWVHQVCISLCGYNHCVSKAILQ